MAETIGHMINRIQTLYSKGANSDDNLLEDRLIYHKMKNLKNMLIIQKANNKRYINPFSFDTINCIELKLVPLNECPCIPYKGCKIYRSKYKIPKILSGRTGMLFKSIVNISGERVLSIVSEEERIYKKGSKYTKDKPDAFIKDGYLFLNAPTDIGKVVSITALFEDEEEVAKFKTYCYEEEECEDCCVSMYERPFKIDHDLVETVIEMCYNEFLQIFPIMNKDIDNDSAEDGDQQQQQRR